MNAEQTNQSGDNTQARPESKVERMQQGSETPSAPSVEFEDQQKHLDTQRSETNADQRQRALTSTEVAILAKRGQIKATLGDASKQIGHSLQLVDTNPDGSEKVILPGRSPQEVSMLKDLETKNKHIIPDQPAQESGSEKTDSMEKSNTPPEQALPLSGASALPPMEAPPLIPESRSKSLDSSWESLSYISGSSDSSSKSSEPIANEGKLSADNYIGESIQRQIQPNPDYVCTADDLSNPYKVIDWNPNAGLERIAQKQIGPLKPEASPEEKSQYARDVQNYVIEIKAINSIKDKDTGQYGKIPDLRNGQHLILPGHNADGSLVLEDKDTHSRTTRLQDGSIRWQAKDGHGYESKRGSNGSYAEQHFGKQASENYKIERSPDGHYKLTDAHGQSTDKTVYDGKHPDARVEAARLRDLAENKISNPAERLAFIHNMELFDKRARSEQISPEQQARVYHEISRLLQSEKSALCNPDKLAKPGDLKDIARELIWHAAEPAKIDQGWHKTCAVASLESQMFRKDPADAARLIADVAINGTFVASGNTYSPDSSILAAGVGADNKLTDGKRSYASQIFQGTTADMFAQKHGYRYAQEDPKSRRDTGEVLIKNGKPQEFNGIASRDLIDINELITQGRNPLTIIEYQTKEISSKDGTSVAYSNGKSQIVDVNGKQGLQNELSRLKASGQLPAIVTVYTNTEPFWIDSRGPAAGGAENAHDICIDNFDAKTGRVSINNQWSSAADYRFEDHKSVGLQQLAIAIIPSKEGQANAISAEIRENRNAKVFDPALELEFGRLCWESGKLSDVQYQAQVRATMSLAEKAASDSAKHVAKLKSDVEAASKTEKADEKRIHQLKEELRIAEQKRLIEQQLRDAARLQYGFMNHNFQGKTGTVL